MTLRVSSGYFTWCVTSWSVCFIIASVILCAAVLILARKRESIYVNEVKRAEDVNGAEEERAKRLILLRKEVLDRWIEWPPLHAVAFLLILIFALVAFFSGFTKG
jgi:hypothetical protein